MLRTAHAHRVPLRLADRAVTSSPVPLLTSAEARVLRIDVSSPAFTRVRRGVYAASVSIAELRPWERYALRVHAFALSHPDAILCLESAAVLHGIPLFGEARDLHVFSPDRTASRRFGDVCVHTSADPRSVVMVGSIPVTSLLDTVTDLARVLPPAQALAAVDASISPAQGGRLELDGLRTAADARVDARGRRTLRWLWGFADSRAESVGESVSRAVIAWSGFEAPILQPILRYEGAEDRPDFLFASVLAIGESDGWGKYDLSDPVAAEVHLRHEKRREDRLRRHGHPFARWTLADAVRVDPLCSALRTASVPLIFGPDRAALATLRRSPRAR